MIPEILSSYFKNKTQGVLKILIKCAKTIHRKIPEILSKHLTTNYGTPLNYFKNKTMDPRDSFRLLQKQDKGSPRFFQITSKIKHKGCPRFFQLLQKQTQGVAEILSNYFKKKTRETRILSNYFKNKIQGNPEFLSDYFKNKTRNLQDSF